MNNSKNIHLYKNSLILGSCPEYFGAYFTSENDIVFKFFTFPEVQQVFLEIKPHNKDVMQLEMTSIGEGRLTMGTDIVSFLNIKVNWFR